MKLMINDSPRNCFINWFFWAPTTFLTPISFIRLKERAVERLTKFMQANISTKRAIVLKMYIFSILPFISSSFLVREFRCMSIRGLNEILSNVWILCSSIALSFFSNSFFFVFCFRRIYVTKAELPQLSRSGSNLR